MKPTVKGLAGSDIYLSHFTRILVILFAAAEQIARRLRLLLYLVEALNIKTSTMVHFDIPGTVKGLVGIDR